MIVQVKLAFFDQISFYFGNDTRDGHSYNEDELELVPDLSNNSHFKDKTHIAKGAHN